MDETEQSNNGVQRGGGALYRQVHADLRRRILGGEFLATGRLPTEPALAAQYRVSVITIRQAQRLLVAENLLRKQQGSGTFVSPDAKSQMKVLWVCGVMPEMEHVHPFFDDVLRFSAEECSELGFGMAHTWIGNYAPAIPMPYDQDDKLMGFLGFVFVNCNDNHKLLAAVRRLGLRHVFLGPVFAGPKRASIDLRGAVRMGLADWGQTAETPIVVGLDYLQTFICEATAALGIPVRFVSIPRFTRSVQYEAEAYMSLRSELLKDPNLRHFLFMDDFVARGGTRALLELGYGRREDISIRVISGRQEVVPLGMPVTWIVHDTRKLVHEGFRLLNDMITGRGDPDAGYVNTYEILTPGSEMSMNGRLE